MCRTWLIAALSSCGTVPNLANKRLGCIHCVCLWKYFELFFSYFNLENLFHFFAFFSNLENCVHLFWQVLKFCWPFWLFYPFYWPFWSSFTSHMHSESLVCQELCGPDAPSSAQGILRQMPLKLFGTIMLLQLGKLQGAELKLALSGWSLAHARAFELKLALFLTWVDSNQFYW